MSGKRETRSIAELALLDARHDDGDVARVRDAHGGVNPRLPIVLHTAVPHELYAGVSSGLEELEFQLVPRSWHERDVCQP